MILEMKMEDPFLGRGEGTLQYMLGIYQDVYGATSEAVLSFTFDKETGDIERFYVGSPPISARQSYGSMHVEGVQGNGRRSVLFITSVSIPDDQTTLCQERIRKVLERYNRCGTAVEFILDHLRPTNTTTLLK